MQNILEVKDLTITIDKQEIIKNLTFNLKTGEILTILGPNGVGKSMLIKALLKLIPYRGKINWEKNINFGYLPQGLTPFSLLNLPLSVSDFFQLKNTQTQKIKKIFTQLNINDGSIFKKKISALSGGEFQKVLLTWSLLNNPNVLILDEPTTGIDRSSQEKIYSYLHKLSKKGVTIILVTHDLNVIYKYSSNVLCLSHNFKCVLPSIEKIDEKLLKKIYEKPIRLYNHNHE